MLPCLNSHGPSSCNEIGAVQVARTSWAFIWRRSMDTESNAIALGVFERQILRKIFDSVRLGDYDFRIFKNKELYNLLNDINVVQSITVLWLHWLDYVFRM